MSGKVLRHTHLITGLLLILFFLLSGQYMQHTLRLSEQPFDAQRMMYRASHLYLLLVGVMNTVVACYWQPFKSRFSRPIQGLSSSALLLAQAAFVVAFLTEPAVVSPDRTLTWLGCVLLLIGAGLLLIARALEYRFSKQTNESTPHAD